MKAELVAACALTASPVLPQQRKQNEDPGLSKWRVQRALVEERDRH